MKPLLLFLFSILLSITPAAIAQEGPKKEQPYLEAIGGLSVICVYNCHVALGRIAHTDLTIADKSQIAVRDATGIMGGMNAANDQIKKLVASVSPADQETLKIISTANANAIAQAKSLIAWIKTGGKGAAAEEAKKNFVAAREKCAQSIVPLGIPLKMLQ